MKAKPFLLLACLALLCFPLQGCGGGGAGTGTGGTGGTGGGGTGGGGTGGGGTGGGGTGGGGTGGGGTGGGGTGGGGGGTGGGGGGVVTRDYRGLYTNGALYTFNIGTSSLTCHNENNGGSTTGNVTFTGGGFKKLWPTTSTDGNLPVGHGAYYLEISNEALFVMPTTTQGIIMLAALGNPPTTSPTFTLVGSPWSTYDPLSNPNWGTVQYAINGSDFTGSMSLNTLAGNSWGPLASNLTSASGSISGSQNGAMSPQFASLSLGWGLGGFVGVPTLGGDVGVSTVVAGEYRGFVSFGSAPMAVYARNLDSTEILGNTFQGGEAGIDAGSESKSATTQFVISFLSESPSGVFRCSVQTQSGFYAVDLVCSTIGGKMVLIGLDDAGGNIVLVQQ